MLTDAYFKLGNKFDAYVKDLKELSDLNALDNFCQMHSYSRSTLDDLGVFYINNGTELMHPKYSDFLENFGVISNTNRRPIFNRRIVFPIRDEHGHVINLVGYSHESDQPYIYGTGKYYSRRDTLYGLENLTQSYEDGYAIVVEELTDAIMLKELQFKNVFAWCSTAESAWKLRVLNRLRHGIIRIPGRNSAGLHALSKMDAFRHMTLYVSVQFKDIDEMCFKGGTDIQQRTKGVIDAAIGWIKSQEHQNVKTACESFTMMFDG